MCDTASVRTRDEVIKSIKDVIVCQGNDVNAIKESILSYVEAQSSVPGEFPSGFLESFKLLVQNLVQIQNSLEQEIKPTTETMQNHNENVADDQSFQPEVLGGKHLVQIQADRKEIYRRISSFVSRKRKEVDEWNVQEFCSHQVIDEENPLFEEINSCARVDAVFIPRTGSKSHVKVSKVNNVLGPQIQVRNTVPVDAKTELASSAFSQFESNAIYERLRNMESHLKLDSSARKNIYARLKKLEDTILYLDGCFPEYRIFLEAKTGSPEKQNKMEEPYYASSRSRLYKRMKVLHQELKWKSRKQASESP